MVAYNWGLDVKEIYSGTFEITGGQTLAIYSDGIWMPGCELPYNELTWNRSPILHQKKPGTASVETIQDFHFGAIEGGLDYSRYSFNSLKWNIYIDKNEIMGSNPTDDEKRSKLEYFEALLALFPRTPAQQRKDAIAALDAEFE